MSNFPFPGSGPVAIVGQPLTVVTWFPTVLATCNCEAKSPILIVGFGSIYLCPACGRGFRIFGVTQRDLRQHPAAPVFNIDIVTVQDGKPS